MLVIHPNDKSTRLAQAIYADMNVRIVDDAWYERGIGQLLWMCLITCCVGCMAIICVSTMAIECCRGERRCA